MDPERWALVKGIFNDAVELEAHEQQLLLDERCTDPGIRREVDRLLTHHYGAHRVLDEGFGRVVEEALGGTVTAPDEPVNQRVGDYVVRSLIGRGGTGVVYLAEQDSPRREVALKVLRADVADPRVMRRLEHEAEVLAGLTHPGIASVYASGTLGTGVTARPYLAMELIRGQSITAYADGESLTYRRRIELMIEVGRVIQYAHSCGVIHRDLKPENILIDEHGRVKVIDFGIARVMHREKAATMHTRQGEIIGSLQYMSPEQCGGHAAEVGTRADVYALGVILYELLAGDPPFDLDDVGVIEAVNVMRSTRPRRLGARDSKLRGDVEAIVECAMARDPEMRYESAGALVADLRRYLDRLPIHARHPTVRYQLGRFVQRHKLLVAGACTLVVAVGALVAVATHQWRESVRIRQAIEVILGFSRFNPASYEISLPVKDRISSLRAAAEVVDRYLDDDTDPGTLMAVTDVLTHWFTVVGDYRAAARFAERQAEVAALQFGQDDPRTLRARLLYINLLRLSGRVDDAQAGIDEAVRIQGFEKLDSLIAHVADRTDATFEERTNALRLLDIPFNQGAILSTRGDHDGAVRIYQRILPLQEDLSRDSPDDQQWDVLETRTALGSALIACNRYDEALEVATLLRDVYAAEIPPAMHEHSMALLPANVLRARALLGLGRAEEALPILENAYRLSTAVRGESHPQTRRIADDIEAAGTGTDSP